MLWSLLDNAPGIGRGILQSPVEHIQHSSERPFYFIGFAKQPHLALHTSSLALTQLRRMKAERSHCWSFQVGVRVARKAHAIEKIVIGNEAISFVEAAHFFKRRSAKNCGCLLKS